MNEDNEYKSVCDSCCQPTWYESEQPCKRTVNVKCKCCGQSKGIYKKCKGTLRVIDTSGLDARATRYYKARERVEITYKDGSKVRCWIGKSTGWKPCYLEILRRDSSGGGSLYLPEDATIRGLGIYR